MDGTYPDGISSKPGGSPDDSVDLLGLALLLAARKRFILLFSFVVAVLTAIVVLIVPVSFTATTTIMPPRQQESSAMAMLGQLSGLASLAGGGASSALGLKNPDDLYIGLLQSEHVMDGIVQRFDLMKIYNKKLLTDARKVLKSNTKIQSEKSSLISISVQDHDAKTSSGDGQCIRGSVA